MFTISLNTTQIVPALGNMADRQFPFAVSSALNSLAIRAADAQRASMRSAFTIRTESVLKYGITRIETATKQSFASAVGVSEQRTGSREAFGYLKKFEEGITKTPTQGPTVAVPQLSVRGSKRGIVPSSLRIKAFHFSRHGQRLLGEKRAFIVKGTGHAAGLILQRVGHGRGSKVRVLYVLERSVPIQPILHLQQNAERVALNQWEEIWQQAAAKALATAKP